MGWPAAALGLATLLVGLALLGRALRGPGAGQGEGAAGSPRPGGRLPFREGSAACQGGARTRRAASAAAWPTPRCARTARRPGPLPAALAAAGATLALQSSSLTVIGLLAAADAGSVSLAAAWAGVVGANVASALVPEALIWRPPWWLLALLAAPAAAAWWRGRSPALARAGQGMLGALGVYAGLELIAAAARTVAPPQLLAWAGVGAGLGPYAAGALSTALLFSSALTVGAMQRLAAAGAVPLPAALAFVLGANVGTTADVLLAAAVGGRRGRLTALFHLAFNLVGSVAALPLVPWAAATLARTAVPAAAAVAHAHTAFNLAVAAVALPAVGLLARATGGRAS